MGAEMGLGPTGLAGRRLERLEKNVVWMFGAPRTGSSWLLAMLASNRRVVPVDEPMIGVHLEPMITELIGLPAGDFATNELGMPRWRRGSAYFFASAHRDTWGPDVRRMILRRTDAELKATAHGRKPLAVIKEPNGTQAAELLLGLLPGSRMIFLVRDGRDALDSELAAATTGGWAARIVNSGVKDRSGFLRDRANVWAWRTAAAQRAYATVAPWRRYQVRYEDLLADPMTALNDLGEWLGLDGADWQDAVEAHAFSKVAGRGATEFVRSASPGAWRQSFSSDEQDLVNELIGPQLEALGYSAN